MGALPLGSGAGRPMKWRIESRLPTGVWATELYGLPTREDAERIALDMSVEEPTRTYRAVPQSTPAVKACACGIAYSEEAWQQLRLVADDWKVDEGPALELRDCAGCESTIAIEKWPWDSLQDRSDGACEPIGTPDVDRGDGDVHDERAHRDDDARYQRDMERRP